MRVIHNDALERDPARRLQPADLFPTAEHVESARRLATRHASADLREVVLVRAPIESPTRRIFLALESLQITGSFKVRGAMLAVERRLARRADPKSPLEVIAVSAGNHGIGVALSARTLGARATIVVPSGAPRTKVDKIAAYGATVIHAQSPGYDDAEKEAIELAKARGIDFLSPYDDLDVLVGNGASLAFEIVRALGRVPATVVCPIGGSGLATGLACGLLHEARSFKAPPPAVFGAQSEASSAFAQSLEQGSAVTYLAPAKTLAEGLEGGISERAFERSRRLVAGVAVATEGEIARAMAFAYRELGLVIEGSAAVALVPVLDAATHPVTRDAMLAPLDHNPAQPSEVNDTVVVLTGRNVDPERLSRIVC